MKATVVLCFITFVFDVSHAYKISELELYQRCHAHLTNSAPKLTDPNIKSILSKRKSAVSACRELLNKARLSGSSQLSSKNNEIGVKVLDNFYNIHAAWFDNKIFQNDLSDNIDAFDASEESLYYTKALFDSGMKFSDIFKGKSSYRAIRSKSVPAQTVRRKIASDSFTYLQDTTEVPLVGFVVPEQGDLEGIKNDVLVTVDNFRTTKRSFIINGSMGGGILGNKSYLMKTTSETSYRSDGAIQMPRRWGRSLFKDFLCQELPVINMSTDSLPFVDPFSKTAFRTTNACVSCHASMDQVSGLIRNYNLMQTSNNSRIIVNAFHASSINKSYEWKSDGDSNYYKQTPNGLFYYRTLDDQLISKNVDSLDALGNLMVQLDDLYMCTASKYLEHFTGVKYPLSKVKYEKDHIYSKTIRSLASTLKSTQDPLALVNKILGLNLYRDSSYMLGDQ